MSKTTRGLTRRRAAALLVPSALAAAPASKQESIRKVQGRFIAPCCWQESVAVHRSPKAEEMRAEIAAALAAGKTEEQIVESYVGQYGERILLEPRGNRSWWLIITPLAALVTGGVILAQTVKRKAAVAAAAPPVQAPPVEVNDADLEW